MALFKPKGSSGGGSNKFMGICELGIVGFVDKSAFGREPQEPLPYMGYHESESF